MEERGAIRGEDGEIDRICCLCGDVGFADDLLRCPRCGYRLQHTYCSRLYPDRIEMESWGCEWCIHHQHQQQQNHREEEEKTSSKKGIVGGGGHAHVMKGVVGPRRSSKAVDRWRKLARAAKMGSARRYKLLADVICS